VKQNGGRNEKFFFLNLTNFFSKTIDCSENFLTTKIS